MISIIIPTYNVEKYVKKCLDSVLAQTYQDFEVIIIDDCSTDGTMRILKEYRNKDPRIKVYRTSENSGVGIVRNIALTKISGEYLTFIDSDDYWLPNRLDDMLGCLIERNVDVVIAPSIGWNTPLYKEGYMTLQDVKQTHIACWFKLMKSGRIGSFGNARYAEDIKFHNESLNGAKIYYLHSFSYYYRDTPNSLTKTKGAICKNV